MASQLQKTHINRREKAQKVTNMTTETIENIFSKNP
jgi:hypothetical protein